MSCENKYFTFHKCSILGTTVQAEVFDFDVVITDKQFFYECISDFNPSEIIEKSASSTISNGMFFSGDKRLVIEAFEETRRVGFHTAHMHCVDEDGNNRIFKWIIEVKP